MPVERKEFQTGLAVAVEDGYEVQVRARSGLSAKEGVTVINGVGTIDSDYRGQIGVALVNLNHNCHVTIHKGDRIAQLVVNKIEQPEIIVVDELGETIRGEGGFGSTGK
jgi:dUTP pyrophosphatase